MRVMLVAEESTEWTEIVSAGLLDAGHKVVVSLTSTCDLSRQVEKVDPDIIIIGTDSPSRDSLEHVSIVSRDQPRPIVMFTSDDDSSTIRAAVKAGITAYVVDGLEPTRLQSIMEVAMARFQEHQALKTELERTKLEIADRKVVERAKGVLMKQRGCDEETAYSTIRKLAMDRNIRIGEAARQILAVAQLLG